MIREQHTVLWRRIDEDTYRYTSAGVQFSADLKVNKVGFVVNYPAFFQTAVESGAQD